MQLRRRIYANIVIHINKLVNIINKKIIDLYRNDGQIILRNSNGRTTQKIRKQTIENFNTLGFTIGHKINGRSSKFLRYDIQFKPYIQTIQKNRKRLYIYIKKLYP